MRREKREEQKLPSIHELTVPDELIAWGKQPEVARSWAAPFAHEAERLMRQRDVLQHDEVERLLSLLEGICREAIRAGRQELLLGFDIFTADWLGLRYTFDTADGPVTLGRDVTYRELHTIIESGVSADGVSFARRCKELVSDVFPQAKIGAILPEQETSEPCVGCGQSVSAVMLKMEGGSQYCSSCWSDMTRRWPRKEGRKKSKRKRKRGKAR